MKKDIILSFVLSFIQVILIIAIKGFSYPLLLLFLLLGILTYISIEDWKTGLISIVLNFITFTLAGIYAVLDNINLKSVGINFLIFVFPFIIIEFIFQVFINRGKDEERFLIGGGDIVLFATMSLILSTFNMCAMMFFACLMSLVASKITKKSLVHFAPFIQIGFLIVLLFGDKLSSVLLRL